MADLTDLQSAATTKIIGSDSAGVETNPLAVDVSGNITVNQGAAGAANWLTNIAAFGGAAVALGQTTMANSIPITIASNQSALAVSQSGTWTTARSWTLSSGTDSVAAVQSGTWNINNISGVISLPTGAATEATLLNVLTTAAFQARINTLGQKTMANSTPITIASDQSAIPVTQSTSPWVTNVSQIGGSAVTTLAAGEQKVAVEGLAANGAAASGNPVMTAGKDDAGVTRTFRTDPAGNQRVVLGPVPSNATYGNPFGQSISTNPSGKLFPLRATAYVEQTSNAQRSVKSSSALDTNTAGTGARQIVITYLDSTGAGPFTETISLNGTTAVNTVSTTICYIEEIHVVSVGSTGSNQGTISLYTTTAGGGTVFASIGVGTIASNGNVGDNQTIWAHHYTPTGKTTTMVATAFGTNGNQTGNGHVRSQSLSATTNPELQITGTIVLDASSPTITRTYQIPVTIVGPARTTFYGVSAGTNTNFYGVFEYWDI